MNTLFKLLSIAVAPFNLILKRTCSNCGWCGYGCFGFGQGGSISMFNTCFQWVTDEADDE
jgi:hypothetical protein